MYSTKLKKYGSQLYVLGYFYNLLKLFLMIILPLYVIGVSVRAAETPITDISISQSYVLGEGETTYSVAKKYNITVEELKNINKFRSFSKPFATLTIGDEIDVPAAHSAKASLLHSDRLESTPQDDGRISNKFAALGAMMSGDNGTTGIESKVGSLMAGQAGGAMQNWLNHYGTARVKINSVDNFSFVNSSLDFLLPIYDIPAATLFMQLGGRNNDDRTTINMGWGVRTFHDAWMYGMNFFYDNDLTGNNRRAGVGAEAWTDFLKLSANNYFAISDWHQSRDYSDYNERPADGFDVRAQTWIPALPQLGANVVYEKYRGENVALFGKGSQAKNPYAVTVGVSYTPIPLITLGAGYRAGKGNNEDTSINLQVNYRLGDSWQKQIDPSGVAALRTLAVSRYDLVERNNDIVLDYQKQELIRLILPEQLTGSAGETIHIDAQVIAKYGLARIDWDAGELLSAGGATTTPSTQSIAVTLPPFRTGDGAINAYHLRARAFDNHGNGSNQAEVVINVAPPSDLLIINSLSVTQDNALADGLAINEVQAEVTRAGQKVVGQAVSFSATNGASVTSPVITDDSGIATARLTSLNDGTSQVTARVAASSQVVDVHFTAIALPDAGNTTLEVLTGGDKVADAIDAHQVRLTVRDINNQVLADLPVTFTADNGATVTPASGRTLDDGTLSANVTTSTPGPVRVTATVGGISKTSAEMMFIERVVTLSIGVVLSNGLSDGVQQNIAAVEARDADGNLLPDVQLALSAEYNLPGNPGTLTIVSPVNTMTDSNGRAEVRYTSTTNGSVTLTARLNNGNMVSGTGGLFAQPTAVWRVITNNQPANNISFNSIEVTLTSPRGERIPNARIDLSLARVQGGAQFISAGRVAVTPVFTLDDGTAIIDVANGTPEVNVIVIGALAAYNQGMSIDSNGFYLNFLTP